MSRILCVHGIGQQTKGEDTLHGPWVSALRDGVRRAGGTPPKPDDVVMAFYGDLFRKRGTKTASTPLYDETDITGEWEKALLEQWWREASRVETAVPGPDDRTKLRAARPVQRALNALSQSRFFTGLVERVFIADLKQVSVYFHDEETRGAAKRSVETTLTDEVRVVVAHSLGTVVAYEAIASDPDHRVHTFVTLGSPLGIRNLIFDRLRPAPDGSGGIWPGNLSTWVNVADGGDVVALVKELRPCFGDRVDDRLVHNGATAHDVVPYLTAAETGEAVVRGLGG